MTIVAGRAIAAEIKKEITVLIAKRPLAPHLTIIACAPNFETQAYLTLKTKVATDLGITLQTIILPEATTTMDMVATVTAAAQACDGLIVQLPLPAHITTEAVLQAIPASKDVDAFGYAGEVTEALPPVIGAIASIAKIHEVTFAGKRVVIFGSGRLVGAPASVYAQALGANVVIITPETTTAEVAAATLQADIIILGAGKPGLLTPDMIRAGVVIFDAGASEDGGMIVGDADPACAEVAALFTPVPGGIGPITIAILFRNLVILSSRQ